jgi:hypothetical protein
MNSIVEWTVSLAQCGIDRTMGGLLETGEEKEEQRLLLICDEETRNS